MDALPDAIELQKRMWAMECTPTRLKSLVGYRARSLIHATKKEIDDLVVFETRDGSIVTVREIVPVISRVSIQIQGSELGLSAPRA